MSSSRDALAEMLRAVGRRRAPPRDDYEQVLAAATQAWQRKLRSRQRRRWLLATAAALMTAAVGVATLLHWMPRKAVVATAVVLRGNVAIRVADDVAWQPLQPGSAISVGTRVRTGNGGALALALNGGTAVRVKEHSDLTLASVHALRLEIGTVYVDSGEAPNTRSVRIETDVGTVRDIGTIFEVHAMPESVRIRVREGHIELDTPRNAARLPAGEGQQLEVDPQGAIRRGTIARYDPAWRWAEALAATPEIEGRPLLQFLTWVARETGRRLQFQEPAVEALAREVVLHGDTRDLAPLQALDVMLSTTDLEYVLSSDEVIVIRRRSDPL
jgi:ferric-dicitrate binding protein FerR (iron transport regulator)